MKTPEEFLESNGFVSRGLDRAALIAAFQHEMDAGLAGKPSSLMMIPSYVSPNHEIPRDKPVTVLDAGGTNLRGAAVSVVTPKAVGDETVKIAHKEKTSMPGVKKEVTADEFYEVLAAQVKRVAPHVKSSTIGFCFSYPAESAANGDARLIRWTKDVKAPAVIGQWVGAQLAKRVNAKKPPKIIVANDTVATLLAGKVTEGTTRYSAYIGVILGTGTNTAYVEKNVNITKVKGLDPNGEMAINAESAGFNKFPFSAFDDAFDKKTLDPGRARFEKMIAGVYLGRLGLEIFKAAAKEGFFSPAAAAAIGSLQALESIDLDNFCCGWVNSPNALDTVFAADSDKAVARRLATPVFERAAILTAIHLAAFIIKTGGGTDPASPVCVNIDGSTYYKTRTVSFPKIVKAELDAMLAPRHVSFALTYVDDAPMIGAAVAALMNV